MNFIEQERRDKKVILFGELYKNSSLSDFDWEFGLYNLKKFILKACTFASRDPDTLSEAISCGGIFFADIPVGCGKTHLCSAIFESLCRADSKMFNNTFISYRKERDIYAIGSHFPIHELGKDSDFCDAFSYSFLLIDDVSETWRSEDRKIVMSNFLINRSFDKTVLLSSKPLSDFCKWLGLEESSWPDENVIVMPDSKSFRKRPD